MLVQNTRRYLKIGSLEKCGEKPKLLFILRRLIKRNAITALTPRFSYSHGLWLNQKCAASILIGLAVQAKRLCLVALCRACRPRLSELNHHSSVYKNLCLTGTVTLCIYLNWVVNANTTSRKSLQRCKAEASNLQLSAVSCNLHRFIDLCKAFYDTHIFHKKMPLCSLLKDVLFRSINFGWLFLDEKPQSKSCSKYSKKSFVLCKSVFAFPFLSHMERKRTNNKKAFQST